MTSLTNIPPAIPTSDSVPETQSAITTSLGPTTEQLVAAFAASLLQFAGPKGIAIATLIPAAEQLLATFQAAPQATYTVDELASIVVGTSAHLASLKAHVDALKD